ncbi:hypothetical protein M3Y97_01066000 [Aphelenchoides bicaudatus]|nr:hypothetical protein M3Y97_01066000 [Aphelenchoides bicaudatus]
MGNSNSSGLTDEELKQIEQETGCDHSSTTEKTSQGVLLIWTLKTKGYLTREDFELIPELTMNPLGDRLIDAFFTESVVYSEKNYRDYNLHNPTTIDFGQFARVLSYFRPISTDGQQNDNDLNSRLNKLRFAFSMYDLEKNNFVTRAEFRIILNTMIGADISEEQLDNIVERTIVEADLDKDDKISFEEFCRAMERIDIEHKMSLKFTN